MAVHKENPIVPLFLLKTFSILETSDVEIVTWSEAGDSFIVLDPQRFSAEVIPTYFKHNKFTSFVRQLNFYGFRKVKGKLNFTGKSEQHSWEFKHPFFKKGQPNLLADIRRSSGGGEEAAEQSAPADTEVEGLKRHVAQLTDQVAALTKSVQDMQGIIAQYQLQSAPVSPLAPTSPLPAESAPEDWDIGDDELLMTFLEDLNDGPLAALPVSPDMPAPLSLKRSRSVEAVDERPAQVAKVGEVDPAVVQAVANALTLGAQTSESTLSFEQYAAALSAIVSVAGTSQSQALAATAAVAAVRKQLAVSRNEGELRSAMSQQTT